MSTRSLPQRPSSRQRGLCGPDASTRQGLPKALRSAVIATLAGIALLAPPQHAAAQGGPARVIVAPVEAREIADTAPVIARLVGTREAEVAVRAAGIVESVEFDPGDRLTEGQPMIRLDRTLSRIAERNAAAALAAAKAAVEVAEARARQTEQALERAGGLQGSTAFSRGVFEDLQQAAAEARAGITRAEAERGIAQAALARTRYDLHHMVLRAPFDGVVVERMAQPGQYVDLGEAAARLLDIASLEIEADIPVDLMVGIRPGIAISATFDGGLNTTARVRSLLPVETTATRTRIVRLTIDGEALPDAVAATGRSITLSVPVSAPRSAPVIPKDALVQGLGGWTVFVADAGEAEPRTVSLGQSAGAMIEITTGLSTGEHVVIRGNERLRPGQPIAPVFADGTPLPDPGEAPSEAVGDDRGEAAAASGSAVDAAATGSAEQPAATISVIQRTDAEASE